MSSLQNFPILHQLVFWAYLLTLVSYSTAPDDLAVAIEPRNATPERELIELVRQNKKDSFTRGEELFRSISGEAPFRPVAAQTLVILEIQSARYSEAWKVLSSSTANKANSSLHIGSESLMLWLLIEAASREKAETQFKRVVSYAISSSTQSSDQCELAGFLGGVVGLLECQNREVSGSIRQRARSRV